MLNEILSEEFIQVNVLCTTWKEAIKQCAYPLLLYQKINETYVESMIETVMKFGPYMILLPEIGFFHGVPGDSVKEVCLSLTLFKDPIVFSEWDNQTVKAAFVFGAIDKDSHMEILSKLALLLQNQNFVEKLRAGTDKESLMKIIKDY